jgi:transposase
VDEAGPPGRRSSGSQAPTRPWRALPRLSEEQRAKVPELLARGAPAHGFRGEVWTCGRVAEVIRKEFGVSYHPARVSRLLKTLGQSLQRDPSAERTRQRDEEAIEHRKEERWPSLKKGLWRRGGRSYSPINPVSTSCRAWFVPTPRWARRPSSVNTSPATTSRR